MARSTKSQEVTILNFFREAPLAVANSVFSIVKSEMQERNAEDASNPARTVRRKRRGRKAKAAAEPVAAEPVAQANMFAPEAVVD
jgi:hypothetical protein